MIAAKAEIEHAIDTLGTEEVANRVACFPDLLEALMDFLAWANIHDDGTGTANTQTLCVARNARAAIAKAKGE